MTTFTVNTFNDTHAAILTGPTAGIDAQGNISLRSAIEAINADPGLDHTSDTIVLPAGTYDLNPSFGELALHPSDVLGGTSNPVTSVTITSQGGQAVINAQGRSRVLELQSGSDVTTSFMFEDLTIEEGIATDGGAFFGPTLAAGGAILDYDSPLTLQNVTVTGNEASSTSASQNAEGGGLFSYLGPVTITNGSIQGDAVAQGGGQSLGGGIYIDGAP